MMIGVQISMLSTLFNRAARALCVTFLLISSSAVYPVFADVTRETADPLQALTTIAYEGMATPIGGVFQYSGGSPYMDLGCFSPVHVNSAGDAVFWGQVFKDEKYWDGIFYRSRKTKKTLTDALTKIVATGDVSPQGFPFTRIGLRGGDSTSSPHFANVFTDSGEVLFYGCFTDGTEVCHIYLYSKGTINTVYAPDDIVMTKEVMIGSKPTLLEGHMLASSTENINNRGDIAAYARIGFYTPGTYGSGGSPWEEELGIYLKPSGGMWQRVINWRGDVEPGGLYIFAYYPQVILGHGGHIAFTCGLAETDSLYAPAVSAMLLRSPDGTLKTILKTGDKLPRNGLPGETEVVVDNLCLKGLNKHGQVVGVVTQNSTNPTYCPTEHLYVFSEGAHKIINHGDPSPNKKWGVDMLFEISACGVPITVAINDNGVESGGPIPGLGAEAVFFAPARAGVTLYRDVYYYTTGGKIGTVALEQDPAPTPPGGELNWKLGWVVPAINNNHDVFLSAKTGLPGHHHGLILLASLDSDGDGLLDDWEINGIDVDGDGKPELNLPAMGANPLHKDIFVEVDYMTDSPTSWHRPRDDAITAVKRAFENAPVENPDGNKGINLHVLIDDDIPHSEDLHMWEGFDELKKAYFGTKDNRNDPNKENILKAKKMIFRYCIFGHTYATQETSTSPWKTTRSSGRAEYPGNDFLVSLGAFTDGVGTRDDQAATFMHELGHTLGLGHGGGDRINNKPNYLSIMSYSRQLTRYLPERPLDYSRSVLPTLDESCLNEPVGVGGQGGDYTVFFRDTYPKDGYNDTPETVSAASVPVDWNWDGPPDDTGFPQDLNSLFWGIDPITGEERWMSGDARDADLQVMVGYDDWSNLLYNFRHTLGYADGTHPDVAPPEMTWELVQAVQKLFNPDQTIEVPLTTGWNLISLPYQPASMSPKTVLGSISTENSLVWAYPDQILKFYAPSHPMCSTLSSVEPGKGYWVNMKSPMSLTVTGYVPPPSIYLLKGWNLVGWNKSTPSSPAAALSSISDKYCIVWGYKNQTWQFYDPADDQGNTLNSFDPGYGYWIKTNEAVTWTY